MQIKVDFDQLYDALVDYAAENDLTKMLDKHREGLLIDRQTFNKIAMNTVLLCNQDNINSSDYTLS